MKTLRLILLLAAFTILISGCLGSPLAQRKPTPSPTFTRTPKPTFTPTPSEATPAPPATLPSFATPSPQATTPASPPPSPTPISQPGTAFQSPLATPSPTEGSVGVVKAVVTIAELNIRSGPGTVYPVLGKARLNDAFTVLARDAKGDWLQLCCIGGKEGWAMAQYLRLEGGSIDSVSIAQTIPPTPTPRPRPKPTPVPPPPPPSMPYVLTSVKCMGSGSAYLKVFVRAGGQPQGGVNVVFVPVGVCNGPTTPIDGSRGCTLKVDGPLPGNWQVYLTDAAGNRISDYANVKTDSSGCIAAEIYFDHR